MAETSFVVGDVAKRRTDVEVIDARQFVRDSAGDVVDIPASGPTVQLWPHVHGTDGMFLALLRKKG